jgi:alcohol dehydrogenase class IV
MTGGPAPVRGGHDRADRVVERIEGELNRAVRVHAAEPVEANGQMVAANLSALPALAERCGVRRAIVVVDRGAVEASGHSGELRALVRGLAVAEFDAFSPNPRAAEAAEAARWAHRADADGVIAVGGGSCCDVAKASALCARTPGMADAVIRGEVPALTTPLPIIAVPTTSGSGSEATGFAALYVGARKVSVGAGLVRPACVVLDERLHASMPREVAAASGLDALSHAVESLWAVASTELSRAFARAAGAIIAGALVPSVTAGGAGPRRAMMIGAYLAGRAIGIGTTTAAHALAYGLTQRLGLAHGHAAALTLGRVAAWNARATTEDCRDPRGVPWVADACLEAAGLLGVVPEAMPGVIADLLHALGLPATARDAGATPETIRTIAESVDPVRLANNPRRVRTGDAVAMLTP